MSYLATIGLGVLIGVVMGTLGGGGGILAVPVLVYVLGQSPQDAVTSSLVIVGLAAAFAVVGRARANQVRWRVGLIFGVAGIPAAYAGTAINRRIDDSALLVGFAAIMVITAVGMLVPPSRDSDSADTKGRPGADGNNPTPGRSAARHFVLVVGVGLTVGFLTGLFGVGGGFVIVPALILLLAFPVPVAAGTSLMVIALNAASSLVARTTDLVLDWGIIIPFTLAAMIGTFIGRKAAARLPSATLNRAFAALLLVVAGYVSVINLHHVI